MDSYNPAAATLRKSDLSIAPPLTATGNPAFDAGSEPRFRTHSLDAAGPQSDLNGATLEGGLNLSLAIDSPM